HRVMVWNRTASRATEHARLHGTRAAASVAEAAAAGVDAVIAMVADDGASRSTWLEDGEALAQVPAGSVAIQCSTLSVGWTEELERAAVAAGRAFVAAPVVGSRPQADAQQLVILAGGTPDGVAVAKRILQPTAVRVIDLGAPADAARVKLAINTAFAVQAATWAELLAALQNLPGGTDAAVELFGSLPVASPAMQRMLQLMRDRQFAPSFPVSLVAKDLRYATSAFGEDARMTAAAR